jgi:hypothetical protein
MKKLIVDEIEYNIPESWEEINLRKFTKIQKLRERENEMESQDFSFELLSVVSGIDRDEIKELEMKDFNFLTDCIEKFFKSELKADKDLVVFKLNDTYYSMDSNPDKWHIGQWIEMDNIIKLGNPWDNADKICSFLLREAVNTNDLTFKGKIILKRKLTNKDFKLEKYNAEKSKERERIFMEFLPITKVFTCVSFFLHIAHIFQSNTNNFTQKLTGQN